MKKTKARAERRGIFRLFLFAENAQGLSRGKQLGFFAWNAVCLFGASCVICLMTLLMAYGPYSSEIFFGYFSKPLILLLNLLPILLVQLLLYACTGRQWLAYLLTALIFIIGAISDYYKLALRNDPVVFSDLSLMFTAIGFAGKYDTQLTRRVLLVAASVPAGTVFLLLFARARTGWKGRLTLALCALLPLYPLWALVYSQKDVYNAPALQNQDAIFEWSDTQQMVSRGFVYPFFYSATRVYEPIPEGYSEEAVVQTLSAFTDEQIPENKKVNLIAIQLEAFADLEKLGIDGIDPAAYADYHALQADSYHGELVTNIFAGGTVDTERCFLTGAVTLHRYVRNTPSYAWYLKSQGYQTVGSHPCTWEYYNRRSINSYLGFDSYQFMENRFQQLTWDKVAYDGVLFPEILRQYTEAAQQGPVFDFTVSYQGHGPYNTEHLINDEVLWSSDTCSDEAYYVLNNYLSCVKSTGAQLQYLTQELSASDTPVVVVIFGDHKPWMGNDASIYEELGVDFDLSAQQGVLNYYGTEYLIWANEAAKKVTGFSFQGEGPDTCSGFLMNLVFDTLGWKGPAYMQYTEQLRQTLPVVTSVGIYFDREGLTHELTEQEQALLSELLCVQYYRHRHFNTVS